MRTSILLRSLVFSLPLVVAIGCSSIENVTEDRTPSMSPNGTLAIPLGPDGMLLIPPTPPGEPPASAISIRNPDKDSIGSSAPIWSPDGTRLIFFTAQDPENQKRDGWRDQWAASPNGVVSIPMLVEFKCWLAQSPGDGDLEPIEPVELFGGKINHLGYVTGNLIGRWQKGGTQIIFTALNEEGKVELHQYDMESRDTRRWTEFGASSLVFSRHNSTNQVAVLGVTTEDDNSLNPFVASVGDDDKWVIHDTDKAPSINIDENTSPLGWLQRSKPNWNANGTRFCLLLGMSEAASGQPRRPVAAVEIEPEDGAAGNPAVDETKDAAKDAGKDAEPIYTPRQLWVLEPPKKAGRVLHESMSQISDRHWHPMLDVIGWRTGNKTTAADITIYDFSEGKSRRAVSDALGFAGWSSDSRRMLVLKAARDDEFQRADGNADGRDVDEEATGARRSELMPDVRLVGLMATYSVPSVDLVAVDPLGDAPDRILIPDAHIDFVAPTSDGQCAAWLSVQAPLSMWNMLVAGQSTGIPIQVNLTDGEIRWHDIGMTSTVHHARFAQRMGQHREALELFKRSYKGLGELEPSFRYTHAPEIYESVSWHALGEIEKARTTHSSFQPLHQLAFTQILQQFNAEERPHDIAALFTAIQTVEAYMTARRSDLANDWFAHAPENEPPVEAIARRIALAQLTLTRDDKTGYVELVSGELFPLWVANSKIEFPPTELELQEWIENHREGNFAADVGVPATVMWPLFRAQTYAKFSPQKRRDLAATWRQYEFSSEREHHLLACQIVIRALALADGNQQLVTELEQQISRNRLWRALSKDKPNPFKRFENPTPTY